MNIIDKIFKIDKRIENIISKSTFFSREGSPVWQTGDFVLMKDGKGNYIKAYKEELYIYGCVWLISNTIASLPLKIYTDKKDKDGNVKKQELITHPAYKLFIKPNFRDSIYDLKESISANLELTGNAYLLLDQIDGKGIPKSIYSLISSQMKIIKNEEAETISELKDFIKEYEYGNKTKYQLNEIIHERKFNPDDEYYGMSPIEAGALTIDTTIESKQQNYNIFRNGMTPDGQFQTDQPFNKNSDDRVKEYLKQKHFGNEHSHEPLILWNGLKYNNIGISPRDLEYIAGLKLSREELCGFLYQVPIILLGILENASYNNIKEAMKIFYYTSIMPRLVKNQEMFQKLIDLYKVEGAYIEYDLSNVEALKENLNEKIIRAKDLFSIGVPMEIINEYLELGLKEYKGWDRGYLPFNLSPVGSAEKPIQEPQEIQEGKRFNNIIKYTKEQKQQKWIKFKDLTDKLETNYMQEVDIFFEAQQREVINNLDKYKNINYEKLNSAVRFYEKIIDGNLETKATIDIDSILFDYESNVLKYKKITKKVYTSAIEQSAKQEIELFNLGISFDIDNSRIRRWVDKEGLRKSKEINDTAKENIRQALLDGINEGEGIADLKKRIIEVYDGYKDEKWKAERIARTEMTSASNEGCLESYRQAEVVEGKSWLNEPDARDTHIDAGNRYSEDNPIGIDEEFIVGAGRGLYPGAIGLAEEDCNCRCTILPVVRKPSG